MLSILPFVSLYLIFINLWKSDSLGAFCRREIFLMASVIWCGLFVLSLEIMNLFAGVTFSNIFAFWFVTILLGLTVFFKKSQNNRLLWDVKPGQYTFLNKLMFFFTVFFIIMLFVVAFFSSPNTWDSLTCHMARVAHWIQNKSIGHYPTSMEYQLFYLPAVSYMILHLKILAASDIAVNFVQYFFMVGSVVGVSLIAKKFFNATKEGQLIASLFAVTIPMGILQATSTRNDYAVAFFVVCFVFFILGLKQGCSWPYALLAGLSLGLAFLVKGTGYLFSLPVLIVFCLWALVQDKAKLKYIPTVLLMSVLVITGFYARNILASGHLFGVADIHNDISTHSMTFKLFISDIIRNIGMHLGTTINSLNEFFRQGVVNIHETMNVDIRDARSTFGGNAFKIAKTMHEDGAGNLMHLLVIVFSFLTYLFFRDHRKDKNVMKYFLIVVVCPFLVYCWLTKWVATASRYHLPLFVLSAPFVGVVLSRIPKRKIIIMVLLLCLIPSSLPFVYRNATRRMFSASGKATIFNTPRLKQYFQNEQSYFDPYAGAAYFIKDKGYSRIGLIITPNYWEYPLWVLLKGRDEKDVRFEHVELKGEERLFTKKYPLGPFVPEAILVVMRNINEEKIRIKNSPLVYKRILDLGKVKIYAKIEKRE